MQQEGCALSMVANGWEGGLLKLEGRGIEQDLIPYLVQLEFTNVLIEEWIIDPDAHGLLDGSYVLPLPTHYGEVINTDMITCSVDMIIDGGRDPKMFPDPFPKGPCKFPYTFLIRIQSIPYLLVDYSTFLCDGILVLGGNQEILDSVTSFEMELDPPNLPQIFLKLLLKPLVWDTTISVLLWLLLLCYGC